MKPKRVALAVVLIVLLPVVLSGPVAATHTTPIGVDTLTRPHSALTSAPVAQVNTTANGTANETTSTASASTPAQVASAETVRILPIQLEPDFLSVQTVNAGETFNTTGPVAFFSLSEPVDQAAIQEPGARARILEGGHVIIVEYDRDAAPPGKQSLYTLRLFFDDGSARAVELYAAETDIDVGSTSMAEYRPFILDVLEDAEENGYERNPEGAQAHYEDVRETAQLLDSLFTENAKRLWGSLISIVINPLGVAAFLLGAAVIALWMLRSNRTVLEILTNSSSPAVQLREKLWIQYKESQQTAADEHLREILGEMNEIYWSDAFGVNTVAGLADLFRDGVPVRRDGEIRKIGGVDDLEADSIHRSWLEAVTRDHRLPSVELALTDGKKALHRMVTKYGMGHIYGDAYERTVELIDELDESRDITRHTVRDIDHSDAVGGDDD